MQQNYKMTYMVVQFWEKLVLSRVVLRFVGNWLLSTTEQQLSKIVH